MNIIPLGTYRHYKQGHQYEVIGNGVHTETGEPFVIYKPLHLLPDLPPDTLFVRPSKLFFAEVDHEGITTQRFTRI